ncbi:hypothetical protein [Streptomyces sp. NRRL F-5122]|nr:hypothetical protein [Streptomyces sp. NRRL F-5122]
MLVGAAPAAIDVAAGRFLCHLLTSWIGHHCFSGARVDLGADA